MSQGLVCVTKRASPTFFHRQPRLGAIQRLDLAFLIDREHDGVVGRINVQANDLLELGRELRIVGQLKAAYQMRSQAMSAPDSLHRTLRSSRASGHSKCLAAPAAWRYLPQSATPRRASKAWLLTGVLARPRNKLTQAAARYGRAS
jgi:hypothetical protein